MNLIMVTYDLRKPTRDYARFMAALGRLGSCIRPLQSVWYLRTTRTAAQVHDALVHVIDRDDGLLVSDVAMDPVWTTGRLMVSDAEFRAFVEGNPYTSLGSMAAGLGFGGTVAPTLGLSSRLAQELAKLARPR